MIVPDDELHAKTEEVLIEVDVIPECRSHRVRLVDNFGEREGVIAGVKVFTEEDDAVPVEFRTAADHPARQRVVFAEPEPRQLIPKTVILHAKKGHASRCVEQKMRADVTADAAADGRHEVGAEISKIAASVGSIETNVTLDTEDHAISKKVVVPERDASAERGVGCRTANFRKLANINIERRVTHLAEHAKPQQAGAVVILCLCWAGDQGSHAEQERRRGTDDGICCHGRPLVMR